MWVVIDRCFQSLDDDSIGAPARPQQGAATDAVGMMAFQHDLLIHRGDDELLEFARRFVTAGLESSEAVLVVLAPTHLAALRGMVGADFDAVTALSSEAVARNPARLFPLYRTFLTGHHQAVRYRGISLSVWPGRRSEELVECHRQESLLDGCFLGHRSWWLVCPYDADTLGPEIIDAAAMTHRGCYGPDGWAPSPRFAPGPAPWAASEAFVEPPSEVLVDEKFTLSQLMAVRTIVRDRARRLGCNQQQTGDLVVVVNELVSNAIRYGGGSGRLRIWMHDARIVCEVADHGDFAQPWQVQRLPPLESSHGRGLWMVNQLCDLVRFQSDASGTAIRVTISMDGTNGDPS